MTVAKDPKNKAGKRIQREFERLKNGDISSQEYARRVTSIQEYYEI